MPLIAGINAVVVNVKTKGAKADGKTDDGQVISCVRIFVCVSYYCFPGFLYGFISILMLMLYIIGVYLFVS